MVIFSSYVTNYHEGIWCGFFQHLEVVKEQTSTLDHHDDHSHVNILSILKQTKSASWFRELTISQSSWPKVADEPQLGNSLFGCLFHLPAFSRRTKRQDAINSIVQGSSPYQPNSSRTKYLPARWRPMPDVRFVGFGSPPLRNGEMGWLIVIVDHSPIPYYISTSKPH